MISRSDIKLEAKELIRTAQVSALLISAIVVVIGMVLNNITMLFDSNNARYEDLLYAIEHGEAYVSDESAAPSPAAMFATFLVALVTTVLHAGYYSYCMGIRRGQTMRFDSLLDGLPVAGKLIWCDILMSIRIALWSMLFVVPGIVAIYRYRFALYNLMRDPSLSASQAIALSCRQTEGMKWELFVLDLSFLGWQILSVLTLGILEIWVMPYTTLSTLAYYEEAQRRMSVRDNTPFV